MLATAARGDSALMAEVLILRHENAVLRRQINRVRYEPADRAWFAALSSLVPRVRWAEVFPVTSATVLAWHRRLIAGKYITTRQSTTASGCADTRSSATSLHWRREGNSGARTRWQRKKDVSSSTGELQLSLGSVVVFRSRGAVAPELLHADAKA